MRLWSRRSARDAPIEVAVAPIEGPVGVELGRGELVARLAGLASNFEDLRTARHGAVSRAGLPPCVGSPSRLHVCQDDGARRRAHRIELRSTTGADALSLAVTGPDGRRRELEPVDLAARRPEDLTLPGEVAAKVWTALARDRPVRGWREAAHFVRGLLAWAALVEAEAHLSEQDVAAVRHDFEQVLAAEPRNPVVHYNLGALLYARYDEALIREAITHFTVAFSASFRDGSPEIRSVAGQALTGLSLAYGQLYHRFGQTTDEVLVNCRIGARRAVQILTDLHRDTGDEAVVPSILRARHAEAFSLHVIDEPEDIAAAIAIYEDVVRGWERHSGRAPVVILNNLGYQYMALEGRDEPGTSPEAYERAVELFERALGIQPAYEMAWANLGNVQRLLKRPADAERSYRKAIAAAREQGRRYPPAHSELAWVYLEQGRFDDALAEHQAALALTDDPAVRAKALGEWAMGLLAVSRVDDARAAALEGQALLPGQARCRAVLARLDRPPREEAS